MYIKIESKAYENRVQIPHTSQNADEQGHAGSVKPSHEVSITSGGTKLINRMEKEKQIFIPCECASHLLSVISDVEYFNDNKQVRQEFWLAMFTYGTYNKKPSLKEKIGIIWNYLKTGKMHEDQIILSPDEAQKLVDFITDNIIETEKD